MKFTKFKCLLKIIQDEALKIENETFIETQLNNWHINAIKDISKLVIKTQLYREPIFQK